MTKLELMQENLRLLQEQEAKISKTTVHKDLIADRQRLVLEKYKMIGVLKDLLEAAEEMYLAAPRWVEKQNMKWKAAIEAARMELERGKR